MEIKEIKINCPEGFEIDKENSTLECIKFKPIENKLPKTWEEFCKTHPRKENEVCFPYQREFSIINVTAGFRRHELVDKSLLPSKELANAMLALCQLIQLRDCYNDGWIPDWNNGYCKYCIEVSKNTITRFNYKSTSRILTFKTAEIRDNFSKNFRDLIEIAKPLL